MPESRSEATSAEFDPEQKRYLEGFMSGLQIARAARAVPASTDGSAGGTAGAAASESVGPDADHLRAQERFLKEGKKLSDPEKFKRELHPFDGYERLKVQAANNEPPKADDNFRWRFYGLFYCAPNQTAYMCRLRIPNGILGLCSRGSGADNIRNVTGTPTAGIDPQELIDTRPYAREWHFHIINDRSLYGIPRKFNVGFDGAGVIPVLEDTNDIGFQAVEVKDGFGIEPGIWFRLLLGGITGHQTFGHGTGVVVKPAEATKVADAVVRVFIDHGDRTNRAKARLKYVIDAWGIDKFLSAMEEKLGCKLTRTPAEAIAPRPDFDRTAHVGAHPQKQPDLNWIGVVLPVGKLTGEQMRGLAAVARNFGDGDIRLTVWQNLLISGIPTQRVGSAEAAIAELGLSTKATSIRAGLVACTGNVGCRLALSNTKRHAEDIAHWCETRLQLDVPVNIHLTGCPNSCAQHYIGDIGLLGTRVPVSEDGDTVEGYHIHVGGGFGPDQGLGREVHRDVKAEDAPTTVERMLKAYLAHRASDKETFAAFTRRHDLDSLKAVFEREAVE
ncbi:MAG: NirA family protein [Alphaproteobacteria bacterium]|nr:MAG: NirA family protein [Alphaproteobacteria bacterium]